MRKYLNNSPIKQYLSINCGNFNYTRFDSIELPEMDNNRIYTATLKSLGGNRKVILETGDKLSPTRFMYLSGDSGIYISTDSGLGEDLETPERRVSECFLFSEDI